MRPADAPMQSKRVRLTISIIVGTPRPSSPISQPCAPRNSTSLEALDLLPILSFKRITFSAFFVPSGNQRGTAKHDTPAVVCASIKNTSHMGADKNHLCPTSEYICPAPGWFTGVAIVLLARTSEPPCFSVMPMPTVMDCFSSMGTLRGS